MANVSDKLSVSKTDIAYKFYEVLMQERLIEEPPEVKTDECKL